MLEQESTNEVVDIDQDDILNFTPSSLGNC
jgi:hypothetical protein